MIRISREAGAALKLLKRRLINNMNGNQPEPTRVDVLLSHARSTAQQDPAHPSSKLLIDLASLASSLQADQAELRRQAFREAVRGLANVIRNRQIPPESTLSSMVPGAYGSAEVLANEIERTGASVRLTIAELRQLRQKLKTTEEGNDEIDEAVRRIYYATLFDRNPSVEDILPPGSPSRSLEIAAFLVERILPNGWWTLGSSSVNVKEPPAAKVGTWAGDNPKAECAATTPLTLLAALVLTLIETEKKQSKD
jgi:hypothetical protein